MKAPTSQTIGYDKQIFQEISNTAQGGFLLVDSVAVTGYAGGQIQSGTVIGFDETTRNAKVCKAAVMQASATNVATAYPVLKGHNLKVGYTVVLQEGGTGRAITSIDTSNGAFDTITVGTTIGVATNAGSALFVSDIGYTAAKGLLLDSVDALASADLAVVTRGTVYENRIPSVPATVKALIPNMIFSKSF